MIVAHHMGEDALIQALAGGAATVPALLVLARARLGRIARTLHLRRYDREGGA